LSEQFFIQVAWSRLWSEQSTLGFAFGLLLFAAAGFSPESGPSS
jgi:hypothetical protein